MEELPPEALRERLDDGCSPRIVDVRQPAAFEQGHIPGSENVPLDELPTAIDRFDGVGDVVTVCPHGEASRSAARLIEAYEGTEGPVYNLFGGLTHWDGPLESGSP